MLVSRPLDRRRGGHRPRSRGVTTRALVAALTLTLAALPAGIVAADAAADKPSITDFELTRSDRGVEVSFRLQNGMSEETLEKIRSGITVTFRHRVEVLVRRAIRIWPSRVIARTKVSTSASYDSLNRRYELRRVIEVSPRGAPDDTAPDEQRNTTESAEEMEAWMTELTEIPPLDLSKLAGDAAARVHVESNLGRRWVLLFPARRTVSAERTLER